MQKLTPPRITPSRDEKYMGLAFIIAGMSKDPKTQVGAVIVAKNNYPLGFGYNGPPRKINDNKINWARTEKNKYIRHAEKNAIDHSDINKLKGSTLYVTARPCPSCMEEIIAKEIGKVIYFNYQADSNSTLSDPAKIAHTNELSELSSIELVEFNGNLNWLRDHIMSLEYLNIFNT